MPMLVPFPASESPASQVAVSTEPQVLPLFCGGVSPGPEPFSRGQDCWRGVFLQGDLVFGCSPHLFPNDANDGRQLVS